jgi:hypothetical protein
MFFISRRRRVKFLGEQHGMRKGRKMGPLFSTALMAIAAGIVFIVVALVFRLFLPSIVAIRCAIGFVIGSGAGTALSVGLLALMLEVDALQTRSELLAYLTTVAVSAALGGSALSWQFARRFRT